MESDLLPINKCTRSGVEADDSDREWRMFRENVLTDIELRDLNLTQTFPYASRSHKRMILDPGHFPGRATYL